MSIFSGKPWNLKKQEPHTKDVGKKDLTPPILSGGRDGGIMEKGNVYAEILIPIEPYLGYLTDAQPQQTPNLKSPSPADTQLTLRTY